METLSKELHRRAVKTFPRRVVKAYHVNDIWAVDLADMKDVLAENDGYRYICTIVDVFSRHACMGLRTEKQGLQDRGRRV